MDLEEAAILFETQLVKKFRAGGDRDLIAKVMSPEMGRKLVILEKAGLIVRKKGGLFRMGPKGEQVLFGMTTARAELERLNQRPELLPHVSITATHIGAVATGSHGQAHCSVNVHLETDRALHRLVEMQDELGALSDELWKILRRVRDLETKGANLKETVDELEIERFKEAMKAKPDLGKALKTLFEASPTLVKIGAALVEAGS